jgi:uncharacterized protein (TIGR04255 family)
VNRIGVGEPFETSATFVRPELHGFLDVELKPAELRYSLTEAEFELSGDTWFHTKWGPVPQGTLVDPGIEAATGQHFLLDLDVFSVGDHRFNVEWIMERMRNYSQSSYRFFRWSLTDEGFALFGGKEYAH